MTYAVAGADVVVHDIKVTGGIFILEVNTEEIRKLVNNLAMYANDLVARECMNLGLKTRLDFWKMVEAMSVSTGNSRVLVDIRRTMPPFPARPPVAQATGAKAPLEDLGTKDKRLALEIAEAVGAKTPIARLMEELDLESTYDAYSL